jgi:hypothetical protein
VEGVRVNDPSVGQPKQSQTPCAWKKEKKRMKSLTEQLQRSFSSWGTKLASVAVIITVALFSLAAGSGDDNDQERGKHNAPQLEGSWEVTVTLHFPDGSDLTLPVPALVSHVAGGVTIASDPSQLAPPPAGLPTTPFHGAWASTGRKLYAFTAKWFQYDAALGAWGEGTLREKVTMTGRNSYEGEGTIEGVNPDGSPFGYGVSTVATRINAE